MSRIKELGEPTAESPLVVQRARLRALAHHWLDTGEMPTPDSPDLLLMLAEVRLLHQESGTNDALEAARGRLERAQARYAKLFDLVPAGILVTTLAGRILETNASFSALVGLDQPLTRDRTLASFVESEDEKTLHDHLFGALHGDTYTSQLTIVARDNHAIPVRMSSIRGEDEQGQPVLLNVMLDISADIAAVKKRQQIERMETVSQLTGGIAQEFNNLLTAMLGATDLLSAQLAHDLEASSLVEHIQEIARRGTDLTQQLLTFAQRRAIMPRPLALDKHLEERTAMLSRILNESGTLRLDLHAHDTLTLIDPAGLDSAIVNLVHNARDAMPHGGVVVISTSIAHRAIDAAARPTPMLLLRVQDTGFGIPPEHLSRIFEPFFTTKKVGQGTGLGLSMVKGFVEQARGAIEATSSQGRGTTMLIYLPIYEPPQPIKPLVLEERPRAEARAVRRILLVEDNEFVRRVTARHLARWGFEVVQSETGDAALPLIDAQRFDAIITDMVMPGSTSGAGVVIHARQRLSKIPILITTGYTDSDMLDDEGLEQSETLLVLSKPYDSATLEDHLRRLLPARDEG